MIAKRAKRTNVSNAKLVKTNFFSASKCAPFCYHINKGQFYATDISLSVILMFQNPDVLIDASHLILPDPDKG